MNEMEVQFVRVGVVFTDTDIINFTKITGLLLLQKIKKKSEKSA